MEQQDTILKLNELYKKIIKAPDLENIIFLLHDYLRNVMDVTKLGIGIYKQTSKSLDFYLYKNGEQELSKVSESLQDENSCAATCFNKQKNIFCTDFRNDYSRYVSKIPDETFEVPKSVIYVPLTVMENKIGVMTVQSDKSNAYSFDDYTLFETLGFIIALDLDDVDIHKELGKAKEKQRKQEQKLTKIKNKLKLDEQVIEDQGQKILTLKEEAEDKGDYLLEVNEILKQRQEQIEEQAEELRKQAEELNKMNKSLRTLNATKDKFFSIIAHDLKNPFQSIIGFTELLLTNFESLSDEKKIGHLNIIYSSAENVFKLLENLLQWARSQTGKIQFEPEEFELDKVIEPNIELVDSLLKDKNIEVSNNIPEGTTVYADKNMINTVIRNLISNAIKFTEDGKLNIEAQAQEGSVTVRISDTGLGIPESKLDTLFEVEKSKSTEGTRNESGTGLGLILCKEFVVKNQGKIWVESKEGEGSTFSFSVPAHAPQGN